MELIERLNTRKNKDGHYVRWGKFKCPFCLQEVERRLFGGLRDKSCGCKANEFKGDSNRGKKFTEEHREKIGQANKGKKRTEEQNKKQSEVRKGKKQPNISLAKKGQPNKNKGKKNPKISEINKQTWANPETRQKRIDGIKLAWTDPNKKHQWVSAANKANSFHKINKIETVLRDFIDNIFPNEYKYTGDGSIIIEGKIPDFVNINGQKKIIELFGNYWHEEGDEQIRKEYFSKYGYKTLIIWEEEMKNLENVKNKLVNFNMKGGGY